MTVFKARYHGDDYWGAFNGGTDKVYLAPLKISTQPAEKDVVCNYSYVVPKVDVTFVTELPPAPKTPGSVVWDADGRAWMLGMSGQFGSFTSNGNYEHHAWEDLNGLYGPMSDKQPEADQALTELGQEVNARDNFIVDLVEGVERAFDIFTITSVSDSEKFVSAINTVKKVLQKYG